MAIAYFLRFIFYFIHLRRNGFRKALKKSPSDFMMKQNFQNKKVYKRIYICSMYSYELIWKNSYRKNFNISSIRFYNGQSGNSLIFSYMEKLENGSNLSNFMTSKLTKKNRKV